MSNFFVKTIKIGLWAMLPVLFTSYISPREMSEEMMTLEGSYDLKTTGDYNLELKGVINYEKALETSSNGTTFSTLKLNLRNNVKGATHSLGFLISKQNSYRQLTEGTYKVSRNIDGFLNYFDGVFGFANIEVLGELPFFAQKGKITILEIGKNNLRGNIDITLENSNGKQLIIKGNFTAVRGVE